MHDPRISRSMRYPTSRTYLAMTMTIVWKFWRTMAILRICLTLHPCTKLRKARGVVCSLSTQTIPKALCRTPPPLMSMATISTSLSSPRVNSLNYQTHSCPAQIHKPIVLETTLTIIFSPTSSTQINLLNERSSLT